MDCWGGVRESLENQTCEMAKIAAKLISENLKYPDGTPVQCVIGCTTIGGGAEAARVAEQFQMENVVATLSVTPCWCYGTETFDMDPNTIKAVWGFNGTERPGAVYLAAVMAAHAQRGLPAFSIYGHDVQDAKDTTIPADVLEKILRFARGAVAVGWMTNKAYVNIGAVAMGIAGSFCDPDVLQKYFGIRAEWVDEVEILRRIAIGIYDPEEYEKEYSSTGRTLPLDRETDYQFRIEAECASGTMEIRVTCGTEEQIYEVSPSEPCRATVSVESGDAEEAQFDIEIQPDTEGGVRVEVLTCP